jgi:Tol biopolymer transport system component
VAFFSAASNLVANDTNGWSDTFVRDRKTGTVELVSVASDGTQGDDQSQYEPAISADGRYVAFNSHANNLVPNDTNICPADFPEPHDQGCLDVFVHDRKTKITERVSVASDGTEGNDHSYEPALSANGRYVAFFSAASNLVANDTNGWSDVFVHDRWRGITERVSVASDGAEGSGASYGGAISAAGRFVVFRSEAENLVFGDTNNVSDVFVHDRKTGTTELVSVTSSETQGNGPSYVVNNSISINGRYVVFASDADNLVPADTNGVSDIFVRDRKKGTTKRISVANNGTQGNQQSAYGAVISYGGRYVAFESDANNLVSGDTNNSTDVFVNDRR